METSGSTSRALTEIETHYLYLKEEWDNSTTRSDLIRLMEEKVLVQEQVHVDSALCLGLGPLETTSVHYLDFDFDQGSGGYDDYTAVTMRQTRASLRQLLAFETVIACLRSKFTISNVYFQDRIFDAMEIKFLQRRGHTVLSFNHAAAGTIRAWQSDTNSWLVPGLDPALHPLMSSSTMIFAPDLDFTVLFELFYNCRPSLYLGTNILRCITSEEYRYRFLPRYYPAEDFPDFLATYDDPLIAKGVRGMHTTPEQEFVFMWPADLGGEDEGAIEEATLEAEEVRGEMSRVRRQ
ncbi:hypothetical protein L207DRAFT_564316 [Hyaloscypha variabilis F]|uniref:SRR1-like domain-containing protein n=1 Tax=Hyaloscypha variabilis (strain UAMH 11265 / GT02V1 / F) TaxID=1149755 RepID=A0A2J6RYU0_HYAVF|nr:hypothetical protein L207DRAFT_564316 [Hyaloscypha variabilis F]